MARWTSAIAGRCSGASFSVRWHRRWHSAWRITPSWKGRLCWTPRWADWIMASREVLGDT
eukprot:2875827-Alexandrium_andersonii.AAC.1